LLKSLHPRKISSALVGAGILTLAGAAHAAAPTNAQLQKQIEELKALVSSLQQQVQARPAAAAESARGATQEAVVVAPQVAATDEAGAPDKLESATKADIDGLRTDLENYKYEQKRNRETRTALTTRGTTIGGSVQVRATAQEQANRAGSTAVSADRHSSFDIPQATLNIAGSLYRDYSEGRNLDYRLAFAYAKTSPGTDASQLNATDAYIRYSPFPTLTGLEDPRLTITFGQQQIPFGLEAQIGEELRPVINSAQFLGGLGVGTRQIGLIVRGDYDPYVDYGFNYRAPPGRICLRRRQRQWSEQVGRQQQQGLPGAPGLYAAGRLFQPAA
jgi:hypothetical protein